MKRCAEAMAPFAERYKNSHARFLDNLLRRVALLSIVHYSYAEDFTLDEFFANDVSLSFIKRKPDAPVDLRIERIRKVSDALSYVHHRWEIPIRDFLEKGYLDASADAIFKEAEERHAFDDLNEQHSKIWRLFNNSFGASQVEFVTKQIEFLKAHCEDLRFRDVYTAVSLLSRFIGETEELNEILRRAIGVAHKNVDANDPWDRQLEGVPDALKKEILAKVSAARPARSLAELAEILGGESHYDPAKFVEFSQFGTQDFIDWLSTEREQSTIRLVDEILQRAFQLPRYNTSIVVEKLKKALEEISKRSKMDELRVAHATSGITALEHHEKASARVREESS
jgi:hypothetical protein